ncbi:MAG: hypothetical protein MOB07_16340 [Acidobacteria bacterium]|nr:hypothetical protein [Acidobacteriota bacterium]
MARTATVKIGNVEAVFDGEKFTSADESTANVLNSALDYYNQVGSLSQDNAPYWPDAFVGLAEAIAKHCGGQLLRFDPREGPKLPEGTVF